MRVVFNTVIFVRSLINPSGLWGKVVFAHAGKYQLVLSRPIVEEILEVVKRPELTMKYRSVGELNAMTLLGFFARATHVEVGEIAAISQEHKDDKFLATALAAQAEYVVSEDRDLLDLKEYEEIHIIDGRAFLVLQRHLVVGQSPWTQARRDVDGFDAVYLSFAANPDLMGLLLVTVAVVLEGVWQCLGSFRISHQRLARLHASPGD